MVAVSGESWSADSRLHWPRFVGGAHVFAGGLRAGGLCRGGGAGVGGCVRGCLGLQAALQWDCPSQLSHPRRSEETARFLINGFVWFLLSE